MLQCFLYHSFITERLDLLDSVMSLWMTADKIDLNDMRSTERKSILSAMIISSCFNQLVESKDPSHQGKQESSNTNPGHFSTVR